MKIIESNGVFKTANVSNTHDSLPPGNYMLKFDPRDGYYLVQKENFRLPKKIYGDQSIIERWMKSYEHNSEKNMGIILSGLKGSGKTITAQKFCIDSGKPVIMITEPFFGSDFIDYLTQYPDAIIFIDEFEKIYPNGDKSNDLLLLMDGNYPTRFIFLLTVNEMKINNFLMNRLNRVKYRKDYTDLDEATMNEVIDDLLVNKAHKASIFKFFRKTNMQTFDLLVNLIKEMNLFNEDAIACAAHLNLESTNRRYEVNELVDGKWEWQSFVEISGDTEMFLFNRSKYPKLPEGFDADNDIEPEVNNYRCQVRLAECKVTQEEKDLLIEYNGSQTDDPPFHKIVLKFTAPYRFMV
jgi:hypothetical protein